MEARLVRIECLFSYKCLKFQWSITLQPLNEKHSKFARWYSLSSTCLHGIINFSENLVKQKIAWQPYWHISVYKHNHKLEQYCYSFFCACACTTLHCWCKPEQRKHNHNHKVHILASYQFTCTFYVLMLMS